VVFNLTITQLGNYFKKYIVFKRYTANLLYIHFTANWNYICITIFRLFLIVLFIDILSIKAHLRIIQVIIQFSMIRMNVISRKMLNEWNVLISFTWRSRVFHYTLLLNTLFKYKLLVTYKIDGVFVTQLFEKA
jgi:hypothetical protein